MYNITITNVTETYRTVGEEHFGGNAVYTRNTDNGTPTDGFEDAVNELDIPVLRYPAGQPDVAYIDGMIVDGQLPQHLVNFLEAARQGGQGVVIVTPTHAAYDGPGDFPKFVELLMQNYGDVVHAFEIGNEYWGHQTETSYGQVANESVLAIGSTLHSLDADVPIWVQMGDAGGTESEFSSKNYTGDDGWLWRNIYANEAILDQLSDEARGLIDGVVEHYYFRDTSQHLGQTNSNTQLIDLDYQIWMNALGDDISLNITEWNIRTTNLDQLGVRAGSTMVAQFSYLMDLGATEAYVWPPQHSTSTDLAGAHTVVTDAETGIVINSVGGATFDLMSSSLVGLERLLVAVTDESSQIMQTVYANEDRVVVYLASRSIEVHDVTFSLGNFWAGSLLDSIILVGYDKDTSDGKHYDYQLDDWVDSDFVWVDGEKYYTNEHDVHAEITTLEIDTDFNPGEFMVTLNPFELVELTFIMPEFSVVNGSEENDLLIATNEDELIQGGAGNDHIAATGGADTIYAGLGDDFVNAGDGSDSVEAGLGDDVLFGFAGNDFLYGEAGLDFLDGGDGNDFLNGGTGSDYLIGGSGHDYFVSVEGADYLSGGEGNDLFVLSSTSTHSGLWAVNTISELQVGTGEIINITGMLRYEVVVDGGDGNDRIRLSNENDAFFLHDSYSDFHGDLDMTLDRLDNYSMARVNDIEEISGGAGDDLIDMVSPDFSLSGQDMIIDGGTGNDSIWGNDANDSIVGGSGDDFLFGGAGHNYLVGGSGADTFQFTQSSLNTVVVDFDPSQGDKIAIYTNYDFQLNYWDFGHNMLTFHFNRGVIEVDINGDSVDDIMLFDAFEIL